MNDLLAFNVEAGWASLIATGIIAVVSVLFHFYGDARWERRGAPAKELDREVKLLQATDAEVKKAIEDLSEKVTATDVTRQGQIERLADEMRKGFQEVTAAMNQSTLSLTKEMALIQGRLAGANGVSKSDA